MDRAGSLQASFLAARIFMLAFKNTEVLPFEQRSGEGVSFLLITLGMTVNLLNVSFASFWVGSFALNLT